MPVQRLLAGALLCALFPAIPAEAKEIRGLQAADAEVAKALPVQIVVLQERLRPQFRYNFVDTSQAGVGAGNSLYNGGGVSYGQAMGMGLAGGLIAGVIINSAEKAAAKAAVRDPYALISQAKCDLPLVDSHQDLVTSAMQRADWHGQGDGPRQVASKDGPRYLFTISTSFSPDFSALMTTVDASGYAPDASNQSTRKPTWQDSLVVVSDGLWLGVKGQADIERMVAAEKQRYAASDAEVLIGKVNAAGGNAARGDRKRALLVAKQHAENMADARDPAWSTAGTAKRRAALWSENDCAMLRNTLRTNLEYADGMIQALLLHSLPVAAETTTNPMSGGVAVVASDSPAALSTEGMEISVGVPEGTTVEAPAPVRAIEPMSGGLYVSRLSFENITLGYRHMVLDD